MGGSAWLVGKPLPSELRRSIPLVRRDGERCARLAVARLVILAASGPSNEQRRRLACCGFTSRISKPLTSEPEAARRGRRNAAGKGTWHRVERTVVGGGGGVGVFPARSAPTPLFLCIAYGY